MDLFVEYRLTWSANYQITASIDASEGDRSYWLHNRGLQAYFFDKLFLFAVVQSDFLRNHFYERGSPLRRNGI